MKTHWITQLKNVLYTENYKALLKQIKKIWINRKISYAYGLEESILFNMTVISSLIYK